MDLNKLVAYLKKCTKIVSKIIFDAKNIKVDNKTSQRDIVTQYDKAVQDKLFSLLRKKYPQVNFVGEENGLGEDVDPYKGEVFIIDPIDGTTNFANDLGASGVSIAYLKDGEVLAGCVAHIFRNEFYTAIKGGGAFKNCKPISVNNYGIKQGLTGFGTSVYYAELIEPTTKIFTRALHNCNDLRRIGSASIDLCYVADGRFSAFFECRLCPYDYAAAKLILEEAGGKVTDFDGNDLRFDKKCSVVAGNMQAYDEILKIVKGE
jgi:myo-inositol-1(or 4)-monophosphatase